MNERKQNKETKKQKKLEKFIKKQSKVKQVENKRTVKQQLSKQEITKKTPEGELKVLGKIPNSYDPVVIEEGWFSWWERKGFFKPETIQKYRKDFRGPYVIPIPPPNVTGKLHIGHAMMIAIQDAIARYKRMHGFQVLFVPGCDHAGIATQMVVEKKLFAEKKLSRYDLGREKFVEKVWEWKNKYGNAIIEQIKRMGTSIDMDRLVFTLEDKMNNTVIEAFVQLYDKKLIYRESKLINWCSKLNTALSDLEVDHKVVKPYTKLLVDGKKYVFGVIYTIKYPLANKGSAEVNDYVEIATTRPETIIGDTALCANPKDGRAEYFKTKVAINPVTKKQIPIVFDEFAEMDFGSGVLKITPAHDFNDYELGKRHNLELVRVFNENNEIITEGNFHKMKRFQTRLKMVEFLKKETLFVSEAGYEQTLPVCSRSGDLLEPLLKKQWWLDCKEMARKSAEAVESGKMKIVPEVAVKQWNYWLLNIRDWCLSRQLWWGHQIPAYRVLKNGESLGWVVARSKEAATKKAKELYGLCVQEFVLEQDPDVLDTWFSSGLWPFAIFGWPRETEDLRNFYPNSILETGSDILFFWVARMVMLSIELTGKIPFGTVLLHGIVRDADGRKMSKSLGNVIDPIYVIEGIGAEKLAESVTSSNLDPREVKNATEGQRKDFPSGIPRCGADALRFTLCSYTSGLKDINLNVLRADGYRKFCNKLWNAFKFILGMLENKRISAKSISKFEEKYLCCNDAFDSLDASSSKKERDAASDAMPERKQKTTKNAKAGHGLYAEQLGKIATGIESQMGKMEVSVPGNVLASERLVIEWLYDKRNSVVRELNSSMEAFNFMNATQCIHQFTLYSYCDVFIEIVKHSQSTDYIAALILIFRDIILSLHPFMPFITEELFQRLKNLNLLNLSESITIEKFPLPIPKKYDSCFVGVLNVCKSIRSIIDSNNIKCADVQVDSKTILFFEKEMKAMCRNIKTVEVVEKVQGRFIDQVNDIRFSILPEDRSTGISENTSSDMDY